MMDWYRGNYRVAWRLGASFAAHLIAICLIDRYQPLGAHALGQFVTTLRALAAWARGEGDFPANAPLEPDPDIMAAIEAEMVLRSLGRLRRPTLGGA